MRLVWALCTLLVLLFCATFVALPQYVNATYGVDVSDLTTVDQFKCLNKTGYRFAVVRAYHSYGGVDTNCPHTVANAWAAGLAHVDVYHFPCYGKKSAAEQAKETVDFLSSSGTKYGMVWLDIETNPSSGCGFSGNHKDNCNFIGDLVTAFAGHGKSVGVYASNYMWESIPGSDCTVAAKQPLWYAHYDGQPSFSDFKPFGGWSRPAIKQYNDKVSACSTSADANWYP